jgi:DNA polymerase-3 subunit delta
MSSEQIKPVYVLQGNDSFLRDAAREQIVSRIIGDSDPQVAVSQFDPKAELAVVLDELRTTPFLAPRRAVIVRDADAFIARYREIETLDAKTNRLKARRPLDEYLQSPSMHSSLILMVSSWPSNTTLAKVVAKVGEVRDCSSPDASELPDFLKKAASRRNKKIQPDAAQLLAAWIGQDLACLESEMEKLSLYVGERPTITVDDVSKLVTATAGAAAFALTNAITAGDTTAALKAMGQMTTRRGEEFKTLGMIVWHLRRALGAQQNIVAGMPPQRALPRMPYDAQGPFIAYLKRRPLEKLQQDFRRLIAVDLAMKSGVRAESAMTELVVQLCV